MRNDVQTIKIAVVDDDYEDVRLVERALDKMGIDYELLHSSNGREFLATLGGEGSGMGVSLPDLVLLDLNMPILNGWDTLSAFRENEAYSTIPVVVLSTSTNREDVLATKALGACSFVSKIDSLSAFTESIQHNVTRWLRLGSSG